MTILLIIAALLVGVVLGIILFIGLMFYASSLGPEEESGLRRQSKAHLCYKT